MKRKLRNLSRHYQAALRVYLKRGKPTGLESARGLGSRALTAGPRTLDLARLHEHTLLTHVLPGCPADKRPANIKQAGSFFGTAITALENTHGSPQKTTAHFRKFIETLIQRTVELAASNLELNLDIARRKTTEEALRNSERHYSQLLVQSDRLQERLRRLSRQILSATNPGRIRIELNWREAVAEAITVHYPHLEMATNSRCVRLQRGSRPSSQARLGMGLQARRLPVSWPGRQMT